VPFRYKVRFPFWEFFSSLYPMPFGQRVVCPIGIAIFSSL
jgi:hypothetical protein